MAITRLYETGIEWGNLLLEFDDLASDGLYELASLVQENTGNYSLAVFPYRPDCYATKILNSSISQGRVTFYLYHTDMNQVTPSVFLSFGNATTTNVIGIAFNGTNLSVLHGNSFTSYHSEAAPDFDVNDTWMRVSVDFKLQATTGWVYVFVNGSPVLDYDGTTNTSGATIDRVHFGHIGTAEWTNVPFFSNYYDDIYIEDTTGEAMPNSGIMRRFLLGVAAGNGNYSQWVGSDADSTDNYLLVDDLPHDNDDTYVTTDTDDVYDSYLIADLTLPGGTAIDAIIPTAVAKKFDENSNVTLQLGTRLSATNRLSTGQVLDTTYTLVRGERQPLNPSDGSWTNASLDTVEAVIKTEI